MVQQESGLQPSRRSEKESIEQDLRRYGIKLGVPLEEAGSSDVESYITVPDEPHVFYSALLRLRENNRTRFTITDAMVMMAHGYGDNFDHWRFLRTQQLIGKTVEAYEKVATSLRLPHLDAILVCRNLNVVQRDKVQVISEQRDIPYIWPESTVRIVRSEYPAGIYYPGEGVAVLIADTGQWHGVDRWRAHWELPTRREYRETRYTTIPEWAKEAALS